MANPTEYSRDYSFSGFQANAPQTPLPGPKVDEELDNLGLSVNQTIAGLKDIRRADGALRNGIVTAEAMAPGIITGLNPATEWQASKQYFVNDTVFYQVAFYRCLTSHISGPDFAVDLAAGRWEKYADLAPIVTDAELARDEAVAAKDVAVASAGTATAAASAASTDASTAAGAATSASASATSAAASYDMFDDRYLGEKTTLPALDNDGNALVNGALVSLTCQVDPQNDGMYVRRAGTWQKMFAATNVLLNYVRFSVADGNLTAGQTTFVIPGGYIAGYADVYRNGLKLVNGVDVTITSGTQIVLAVGVGASDTLEFEGYRVLDSGLFADQAAAEAGTSTTTLMSPLRVKQAIAANPVADGAITDAKIATPATPANGINADKLTLPALSGGGVPISITTAFRREVYAREFGAVTNTGADMRANLQAAIDYAEANGMALRLDAGQYRVGQNPGAPGVALRSLNPVAILGAAGTRTGIDGLSSGMPATVSGLVIAPSGAADSPHYSDIYFGDISNGTSKFQTGILVVTTAAGSNLAEPKFEHIKMGRSVQSGAKSFYHQNDVGLNVNGGLTTASFQDCAFQDLVLLSGSGDQIQFIGCRWQTPGLGFSANLVNAGGGQAGGLQLLGNTFLCGGGAIAVDSSASTYLFFNQIEGITGPGSNNSLIDIAGGAATCLSTHILHNTITSFVATGNVANVRINNCSGVVIDDNEFRITAAMAGLADIRLVSGNNILVGAGNKASGGGVGLVYDPSNLAKKQNGDVWLAAGLGTPYTGSWDAGNTGQEVLTARRLLALEQACRKYGVIV